MTIDFHKAVLDLHVACDQRSVSMIGTLARLYYEAHHKTHGQMRAMVGNIQADFDEISARLAEVEASLLAPAVEAEPVSVIVERIRAVAAE